MKLLSAQEVNTITKENIRNNVLDQVMCKIINAAKNGQYGLKIRSDSYSQEEVDMIFGVLLDLGYDVHTKIDHYVGSLKKYAEITVNWHE